MLSEGGRCGLEHVCGCACCAWVEQPSVPLLLLSRHTVCFIIMHAGLSGGLNSQVSHCSDYHVTQCVLILCTLG